MTILPDMDALVLEKPVPVGTASISRPSPALRNLLIVAAAVFFIVRGPLIPLLQGSLLDLRVHYAATRAFWAGENPYDLQTLDRVWAQAGAPAEQAPDPDSPSLYPPTSFLFLAPFLVLSWHAAVIAWLGIHMLALAALFYCWSNELPAMAIPRMRFWLGICVLILAPLQNAIDHGQTTATVFILVGFAILAANHRKDLAAGLLLAVAMCFKPHLALCLLFYYLVIGRRRIVFFAAAVVAALGAIALGQLWWHHIPWLHDVLANIAGSTAPGGVNDPSLHNGRSEHILNLAVIVYRFTEDRLVVTTLVWTTTVLLAGLCVGPVLRMPKTSANHLLACATILVISTLPLYHRYYDGAFFLFALAWVLIWGENLNPALRTLIIVCSLVFLSPQGTLRVTARHLHIGPAVTETPAWRLLVIYPAWATLGLSIAMVLALREHYVKTRNLL